MSLEKSLIERSGNQCELCASTKDIQVHIVEPKSGSNADECAHICTTCQSQIADPSQADANHWRCLNDSIWNTNPPVQVLAYRMLYHLKSEGWPADLMDMMYMEDETAKWAKDLIEANENAIKHVDVNGVELKAGDSVVLIKDLHVKGSSMIAKRGTAVRRISLDMDNAEYIEGKVDGQRIVIVTQFVKKTK